MNNRLPPRRLPVSLLVVAALLAAACGSDDQAGNDPEPTTVTASPPSNPVADPAPSASSTTTDAPDANASSSTTAAAPIMSTAPATTVAAIDESTEPADDECTRVTDFDTGENDNWVVVNDGVMGGGSAGAVSFEDSAMRFTGNVVTAGGGFTSVRLPLDGELAETSRIALRIRPDDRTYGVRLEADARIGQRPVSYGAEFLTPSPSADGWQVVTVSYGELQPTVFGTPVDASPFAPDAARELGIIIADGVDGPFELDVDWIDACR